MPFVGPSMSSALVGALAGKGFTGSRLRDFADAASIGSQSSIVGKTFTTQDIGTVPGVGTGVGTGLSIPPSLVSNTMLASATSKGFKGSRLPDVCQAFAQALVSEASKISLSSNHSPVFQGTGTVVPSSIPVNESEWGGNINSQGVSRQFVGQRWSDLAQAMAKGGVAGFGVSQGSVTITGSPTSSTTSPGTGSGSGVIS